MPERVDEAAALFGALAHPGRLHVLLLLAERAPRTAGELAAEVGLERTALSHQLAVLREARLVAVTREGRHQLYALADQHVARIVRDALDHVGEPSP